MQNLTIKKSSFILLAGLLLAFIVSDAWLVFHVREQDVALETFSDKQNSFIPGEGATIPPLSGHRIDGKATTIYPSSSPPFLLLVYRESCKYCEANWKYWDDVLLSENLNIPVVFITTDQALSVDYAKRHTALQVSLDVLGIDPASAGSAKLEGTPETILVSGGHVVHDWYGVLSNYDVSEVVKSMSSIKH